MIGDIRWVLWIERVDIIQGVAVLSAFQESPQKGHPENLSIRILSEEKSTVEPLLSPKHPNIDPNTFKWIIKEAFKYQYSSCTFKKGKTSQSNFIFLWFEELMCLLIWAICDENLLSLIKNNNDTWHSKIFSLFNNKSKRSFSDDSIFVSLKHIMFLHIMFLKIYPHGYLTIKMVQNIYGYNCHHNS